MARYPGGVVVSGYISPSDSTDQYATHRADLGKGGYRSVLNITERDNITSIRRELGMIVYVIEEKKEYRLVDGLTNTHWEEIVGGTGMSGSADANYLLTTDIFTRDSIELSKRKVGQITYVINEDKEYRLVDGITNAHWKEIVNGTGVSDCCNYIIVESISDIENYPVEKRFIGLTLYAKDADKEFRFVNGIENIHLKEINSTVVNYNPDGSVTIIQPGDNGGGSSTTVENNTTNISVINNYYNKIGCLNKSLIASVLSGTGNLLNPVYISDGKLIVSGSDKNEFSFKITKSEFWVEDWVYFTGSTKVEPDNISEVYLEYISNGVSKIYNISDIIKGISPSDENLVIMGTEGNWRGYIKGESVGRKEIKVYQQDDGVKIGTLNKTIYFFAPNFAILDGTNPKPQKITINSSSVGKDYQVKVLPNTNLLINLARVNVSAYGIDTNNYTIIPGAQHSVSTDTSITIPIEVLKTLPDGKYSLVVTGSDNGINIPPYFYGPFSIENLIFSSPTGTPTGTTPISPIPNPIAAVLAMPTTATSSGNPVTSASGTSLVNPTPSNSAVLNQFLSILNAIFGPSNQAIIAAEIATMDLSGLTSSNINTYVNQVYTKLTT